MTTKGTNGATRARRADKKSFRLSPFLFNQSAPLSAGRPVTPRPARRLVQPVHRDDFHPCHGCDDELGDSREGFDDEGFLTVVDEHDADLAAEVFVDGAGGVDDADAVTESEAGARADLAFVARRDRERDAGRDET